MTVEWVWNSIQRVYNDQHVNLCLLGGAVLKFYVIQSRNIYILILQNYYKCWNGHRRNEINFIELVYRWYILKYFLCDQILMANNPQRKHFICIFTFSQ